MASRKRCCMRKTAIQHCRLEIMTEAAIDGGITRDLYTALGEELETARGRASLEPFVRWIWPG
ncbi:cytochrome c-type biogenesis CcmF C-terminal domain-containing protein [Shigella flexneri]